MTAAVVVTNVEGAARQREQPRREGADGVTDLRPRMTGVCPPPTMRRQQKKVNDRIPQKNRDAVAPRFCRVWRISLP